MTYTTPSRGFTLIELLTVIAIIGLLSSIALASFETARERARDARRQSDVRQIQNALQLYLVDNRGDYPIVADSYVHQLNSVLVPSYMPALPEDPNRTGTSRYRYYTQTASNGSSYTILIDKEVDGSGWCKVYMSPGYSGWSTYPDC